MPDFADPYVYPGTTVLINRFGIRESHRLAHAEYAATWARRRQLAEEPIAGSFDLQHLKAIHRWLFQDVFSWAGELRTVEIAKS
jgi:cell filamentation protein